MATRRQKKKAQRYADRLRAVSLPAYKGMHLIASDAPTTLCGLAAKNPAPVGADERHRSPCARCRRVMEAKVDQIIGIVR